MDPQDHVARRPGGSQIIPNVPGARPAELPWWTALPAEHRAEFLTPERVLAAVAGRRALDAAAKPEAPREAAVLVPVLAPLSTSSDPSARLLLTRRAGDMGAHAGEIAFPGGAVDPGETLHAAALREAHEEVALDPATVEVVGELDRLATFVTRHVITPVVARVDGLSDGVHALEPSPGEIARIFDVSLVELSGPDVVRTVHWNLGPHGQIVMTAFYLDDETVWGATGRMVRQLLDLTFGPGPQ